MLILSGVNVVLLVLENPTYLMVDMIYMLRSPLSVGATVLVFKIIGAR